MIALVGWVSSAHTSLSRFLVRQLNRTLKGTICTITCKLLVRQNIYRSKIDQYCDAHNYKVLESEVRSMMDSQRTIIYHLELKGASRSIISFTSDLGPDTDSNFARCIQTRWSEEEKGCKNNQPAQSLRGKESYEKKRDRGRSFYVKHQLTKNFILILSI